ncbi:MAG: Rrf2 family transcriptional regulator [Nitrospiraceae bacterium]|nr:Rrf2 family transcriptional regulator [Nitrospiraceae bacterium]
MLVTRKTDYAVRCILYLAQANEQVANVTEVSRQMHIPKTFLAKIFQKLSKAGLVDSIRGMNGGFRLAKKPAEISLLDIMHAIQGPLGINVCAVNSKKCVRSAFCSVHPFWVKLRQDVNRQLQDQTIANMLDGN